MDFPSKLSHAATEKNPFHPLINESVPFTKEPKRHITNAGTAFNIVSTILFISLSHLLLISNVYNHLQVVCCLYLLFICMMF